MTKSGFLLSVTLLSGLSVLASGGAAHAGEASSSRGVVELFTSQGCSSCPPADAAFEELVEDPAMVALSFHVDYWNYLGWTDTMSSPEHTQRQYDYASAFGRSNVYTPQAVLNGRTHLNGADLDSIRSGLKDMAADGRGLDVPVAIKRNGDGIGITVGAGSGKANVVIAYFTRQKKVAIAKGENAGQSVTYRNVVSSVETIGMWDGKKLDLMLPPDVLGKPGRDGGAILVQGEASGGGLGPIRGAGLIPVDAD